MPNSSKHFDAWLAYCEAWRECFPNSKEQPSLSVAVLGVMANKLLASPSERELSINERDDVIDECAEICDARAFAWGASVAEGSESHGYESQVLRECAALIRQKKSP